MLCRYFLIILLYGEESQNINIQRSVGRGNVPDESENEFVQIWSRWYRKWLPLRNSGMPWILLTMGSQGKRLPITVHILVNICVFVFTSAHICTHAHLHTHTPDSHQVSYRIAVYNIMWKISLSVLDTIGCCFGKKFFFPLCRNVYLHSKVLQYSCSAQDHFHSISCWRRKIKKQWEEIWNDPSDLCYNLEFMTAQVPFSEGWKEFIEYLACVQHCNRHWPYRKDRVPASK